jgi:hypothetical protein
MWNRAHVTLARPMGKQHGSRSSLHLNACIRKTTGKNIHLDSKIHAAKSKPTRPASAQLSAKGSKYHPVDHQPALVAYVNSDFSLHRHLFDMGQAVIALVCSPLQHSSCRNELRVVFGNEILSRSGSMIWAASLLLVSGGPLRIQTFATHWPLEQIRVCVQSFSCIPASDHWSSCPMPELEQLIMEPIQRGE